MSKVADAALGMWATLRAGELPAVVAVSGGADSVALLRSLHEAGVRCVVGHFNHRLRGDESDADEAFVREMAGELGVPCHVGTADVRTIATEHRENLEATARRVRYEWLARLATATGCGHVVTGHTLDDQAETVLHRIVRGTGLAGLRGIPVMRLLGDGVELHRPLLRGDVTRADVLGYLTSRGQPYREDSSNADPAFTRNRLRHEVLPLLKTFNPRVAASLSQLSRQASEASGFLDAEARQLLEAARLPPAGELMVLAAEPIAAAHPVLVRAMFRLLWDLSAWHCRAMTLDHWERVARVARGDESAADFPGGVHVRRVERVVQLSRRP